MLLDTPSRPKPATSPARRSICTSPAGSPSSSPRPGGEVGERRRVPERVRRLEVDEAGDRGERRVALAPATTAPPVPARRRAPRPTNPSSSMPWKTLSTSASEAPHEVGVELLARSALGDLDGGVGPAGAVRHLDELGTAGRCATRPGSSAPASVPRPAVAVPPLVGAAERVERDGGQAELARRGRRASARGWRSCRRAPCGRRRRSRLPPAAGAAACCRLPSSRSMSGQVGERWTARARTSSPSWRCRRRTSGPARGRRCGSPR